MSATGLAPWTQRMGNAPWRRLTKERAGSAKTVFHFDVHGSARNPPILGFPGCASFASVSARPPFLAVHRTASWVGTPQGAVISPLLANVYLHYVFDLWTHLWRRRQAKRDVIVIRYADDSVAGFETSEDASAFLDSLRVRLSQFGFSLNETKTRILEFGRYATERRARRGHRRPETFDFLGFMHISLCGG